ncbi:Sodium- and chloride-dependent glycine transporter 2-like protein, partial [Leptotrombidium deliense]
ANLAMQTTPIPKPSEKQPVKRDQWTGNAQFLLACIGNAVGLGNVWRFPYLAYKNGGGAFVIPYIVMVFIIGLPLFLIELSLGQFSALGPAHLYKELCPLLKGVGMASVVASFVVGIYYNMIIAWTIFYFFESFVGQKWQFCGQYFNTKDCFTILDKASKNLTNTSVSAPEEFFNNYVLEKSKGIEEIGGLNWKLVAVLFISWLIVIASLIKGIQTSGKVVYFTATFPYVILVILFFRGVTLEGAFEGKLSRNLSSLAYNVDVQINTKGIKFYVIPNWKKVRELQVWRDAAIQVFYSFGIAGGGMLTYASYNRFTENVVKHSVVIGICDMLTSLFAGFVVFSMLGFMAHTLNKSVEEVVQGGIGLAFIAIPDGLSQMPGSVFWCVSYFVMLFLLGIDSQFAMIETIITFIFDTLRSSKTKINKPFVVSITGLIMFLCGLSLCTKSGIYILELLDTYSAGFPYLLIAFMETIIIAYFYGTLMK